MKTVIAAAALVASVKAYNATDMPSCWSACFTQYDLSDEACLCDDSTGKSISSCIASGCDSADATSYTSWLSSYCSAVSTTTSSSASTTASTYSESLYTSSTPSEYTTSFSVPATTYSVPSTSSALSSPVTYTSPPETTGTISSTAFTRTVWTTVYPSDACGASYTDGQVYTVTTTESITVIPHQKSYSWGDWTSQYTSYETSTATGQYTVTSTYSASTSGASTTGALSPSYSFPAPTKTCSKPYTGAPSATASAACVPCKGQGSGPFCGLDINTDWYSEAPNTCNTVTYDWTITQGTVSPDGVERLAFLVENQFPGPMIKASWGDTIVVRITNSLPNDVLNGTSIHFHGIRQNGTNEMDGVSSITQCPLAPGDTMTYTFRATSYGTSWWHAHYSLQTYEGLFGPMVIEGPAALKYDEDQMFIIQDWNHATVDSIFDDSQLVVPGQQGGPITLDTGLINGKNVWEGAGEYYSMTVQAGKTYRLRLVNTAIQSTFKFHIDGHTFQVIAMDFVPIHPYTTDIVSINIGQRYDLIMTADQSPDNYWIRADNQQPCGTLIQPDVQGILNYEGVALADPTTTGLTYAPDCLDEDSSNLVPIVEMTVGAQNAGEFVETSIIAADGSTPNLYKWTLSGSTFMAQWGNPTLYNIWDSGTYPAYGGDLSIDLPNLGDWVYFVIESPMPLPHPIHLHGHDFFVLAQGTGTYTGDASLNLNNPPRRDVAVMPADPVAGQGGYLVLAYQTSNPGVWLMHCHIGWHNTMGFALQIIEALDSIKVEDSCQMLDVCESWHTYANAFDVFNAPFDDGV